MCGLIAGLLQSTALPTELVRAALRSIEHRGPDHADWWCSRDHRLLLGHVRLSIIGLANGDQPLVNEHGDVRCVVNGELYGYRQIRAEQQAEGRRFATDSDSEIALVRDQWESPIRVAGWKGSAIAGWENSQARSIRPRRLTAGSASASTWTRRRPIPAGNHGVDSGVIILVHGGGSQVGHRSRMSA